MVFAMVGIFVVSVLRIVPACFSLSNSLSLLVI